MLQDWTEFYFILSSSAAGLIGLLFVVVTLTSGLTESRAQRGEKLFMSPTVFQYATVLSIGALATIEHLTRPVLTWSLALCAVIGLIYMGQRLVELSKPAATEHWSDVWYYGVAPLAAYLLMAVTAYGIGTEEAFGKPLLAALMLGLLLLDIRNAWDLVTWIAPRAEKLKAEGDGGSTSA